MMAISMLLFNHFITLILLILFEQTNLLFDILFCEQVFVLLLSLVKPLTNLLLADLDICIILLALIFIN